MAETAEGVTGNWLNVSELARLRGVDKAAISRRVRRLEALGALTTRPGRGGTKLINADEFASAVEQFSDGVREANGRRASARDSESGAPGDPILARELAKRAAADAELKRMDLEERRERILSADQYERFIDTCSANAQGVLLRLPGLVEEIIAVANKDGVTAAKAFVKAHVREAIAEVGALMRVATDPKAGAGDGFAPPPVEVNDANVSAPV